ncbi:MAG: phenylalanine--tRNA ligase beta subunit-related protein [Clostridiales bacterium]|nr:phenylalanine--tRNA ligase beta subunit-related protein [Clostridiales bacterium]
MLYTIMPEVFELNPALCFGVIVARGLANTGTAPEETLRLRKAEERARETIPESELKKQPIIAGYRLVLEKAGINPNKYMNSMEAMMKRVLKGGNLPAINSLVDLCNAVSIENQVSLGGHDLDDIKEDLYVGFSKGGEQFLPFGGEEYETVEPGELIFASGNIVQTRKWIWRQSELGKMTLDTKNVFFQLVGFDDGQGSPLAGALDAFEELLKTKFGGTYCRHVVKKEAPQIEF